MSQKSGGWQGAFTGGLAAMMASSVTQPIDLIKVRLQLSGELESKYQRVSIVDKVGEVYRTAGIRGFYKGLSASLLRQSLYSTSRFGVHAKLQSTLQNYRGRDLRVWENILISVPAGAAGGFLSCPADLVMVRMQADGRLPEAQRRHYRNVFDGLYRILREEGMKSLWRGSVPNINRAIVVTVSQFVSYDKFKKELLATGYFQHGLPLHICSSLLAGFVVAALNSPVDVVRTRMMNTQRANLTIVSSASAASPRYASMIDTIIKMARTEGVRGFYKGFIPYYYRVGPQVVSMFVFYEQLNLLWNKFLK